MEGGIREEDLMLLNLYHEKYKMCSFYINKKLRKADQQQVGEERDRKEEKSAIFWVTFQRPRKPGSRNSILAST